MGVPGGDRTRRSPTTRLLAARRRVGRRWFGQTPSHLRATVDIGGAAVHVDGAQAVIRRGDGRILIQLRPWPPGWELPGGHCDPGEPAAACAAREAREETGLEVRPVALVGVYRWVGLRQSADAVYLFDAVSGTPRRSLEAIAFRWVERGHYPRAIFPWAPLRIGDAIEAGGGAGPVEREQPVTLRHVLFFGSSWAGAIVDAVRRQAWWRRRRGDH